MEKVKKFLFQNTSIRQTVAKNTFWLSLSEITGRLLKMVLVIYAARILGADGWGVFSYALSLSTLLMIFSDIGLSGLITREVIQKKEGYQKFVSTALFLKTGVLAASTFVVIFVGPSISHIGEAVNLFPMISAILFFDSIRDLGFAINRASEKMEREMTVKTIMSFAILLLGLLMLRFDPRPESVALAYALGSAVGFFAILIIIRKDISEFISSTNLKILKEVFKTTWPFAVISLISVIMANTDIFMLGIWKDAREIGLYASVQRIQQFVVILPAVIATASFPIMSRLAHTDQNQFKVILEKTISLSMVIGVPMTFGGIIISPQLVPFIFGTEYIEAIPILQVLMTMLLASFPLLLLSNAIFACNEQKNLVKAYSLGIVANVILNLILIPGFGAEGSAFATLVSTTAITFVIWRKMKTLYDFKILMHLKKTFISSGCMILAMLFLIKIGLSLIPVVLIAILMYFGVLFILKEKAILEIRELLNI